MPALRKPPEPLRGSRPLAKGAQIVIIDAVEYPDRKPGEVFEIPAEGNPEKKTSDFSLYQFPTVNMLHELQEQSRIKINTKLPSNK